MAPTRSATSCEISFGATRREDDHIRKRATALRTADLIAVHQQARVVAAEIEHEPGLFQTLIEIGVALTSAPIPPAIWGKPQGVDAESMSA